MSPTTESLDREARGPTEWLVVKDDEGDCYRWAHS